MSKKQGSTQPADERAALVPAAAPPPYSELPSASTSAARAPSTATPHHAAPPPSHSQPISPRSSARHPAGPTSFASVSPQQAASQYNYHLALRRADRRARKRMCAALCWGFVVYIAIGMLIGGIVGEEVMRNGRKGWDDGRRRMGDWVGGSSAGELVVPGAAVLPPDDTYAII
ncbi:hypothetical protein JCM10207_003702 [Rhodosporidiobolus poonsookiae]